jgi:hypothetical protein
MGEINKMGEGLSELRTLLDQWLRPVSAGLPR